MMDAFLKLRGEHLMLGILLIIIILGTILSLLNPPQSRNSDPCECACTPAAP